MSLLEDTAMRIGQKKDGKIHVINWRNCAADRPV